MKHICEWNQTVTMLTYKLVRQRSRLQNALEGGRIPSDLDQTGAYLVVNDNRIYLEMLSDLSPL